MEPEEKHPERRRYPRIAGPLILIGLGILFLLGNLGLPDIWGTVWRLWPVLLLGWGVEGLVRPWYWRVRFNGTEVEQRYHSVTGPVILLFLGTIFLLQNFGVLQWYAWAGIWRLWPVVLIGLGLDMLLGRRSRILAVAVALALLASLVAGLWYIGPQRYDGYGAGQALTSETVSQSLQGAARGEVVIHSGVSYLRVGGGAGSDNLVEGAVDLSTGETVRRDFHVVGDTASFQLSSQSPPFGPWGSWGRNGRGPTWDLRLTDKVPLRLRLESGVGRTELDLARLQIQELRIDTGVGENTVTMPGQGRVTATISGGVGRTAITIPQGMAARIRVDQGIGHVAVNGNFVRQGKEYVSPDYETAANRLDLKISGGVGAIEIRQGQ